MTQHQTGLTLNELLIELIQTIEKMLAGSPGQDFPRKSLLVIFSESTTDGCCYTGGQLGNKKDMREGGLTDILTEYLLN